MIGHQTYVQLCRQIKTMSLLILTGVTLLSCGAERVPHTTETIEIALKDGTKALFKVPNGYTPYEAETPFKSRRQSFVMDAWMPELSPYWDLRATMKRDGISSSSAEFGKAKYKNQIHIEVSLNLPGFLSIQKETNILPSNVDREFETRFDHFYFLGASAEAPNGPSPGLKFRKTSDGKVWPTTSPYQWYVPIDEEAYASTYIRCTQIKIEPAVTGSCTAYRELNDWIVVAYRFWPGYMSDWPALDEHIESLLRQYLVKLTVKNSP